MEQIFLNIIGTEWIIVIFAALVLLLGTGKLPAAAKKMGRVAADIEKAKNDLIQQARPDPTIRMSGPVKTERQKLEAMAQSLGIDYEDVSDTDLRKTIQDRIGGPPENTG